MDNKTNTANADKPAYPTNARMHSDAQGMTKRELFAMAAMQGMAQFGSYDIKEEVIRRSIAYADELLKQLES